MPSTLFDTAIQNFYAASVGRSQAAPINAVALGVQQLAAGVRQTNPRSKGDSLLQSAITNCYDASLIADKDQVIAKVALGLQQLTAALNKIM